ncbi:MAG: protein phosphatase 2C domain-containing protein, partial [Planctomycetaceae bacterium]|nr:protein phosphatase 2C domain-containing protein [Planctomycetaceae bacterium]
EQAGTPVPPPPPPKPFIKPEWKVLEPEDQTDPVDHEVSETIQRNEQWKIAAASVRGRLHAHKALWRDDAYAVGKVDDWTILVVSDGAGSAPLARIGARACADAARDKLTELLDGFVPSSFAADPSDTSDLGRVKTFLCEAGRASLYAVQREAQQRERQLRDFHATLLVMVHLPLGDRDLVAALQVGDGAVGIYTQDGNCTLLGIADHGEYSSETRFITTPNIEREFGARVLFAAKESVVALAAMCDGISDDFFPEDKRLVELFAGGEIEGMKFANGDSVDGLLYTVAKEEDSGKALLEWMKYEKKGSSDDRTLLLMYRPDLVEKV